MGVLGSIIKTAVEFNQRISLNNGSAIREQQSQLIELLSSAKETAFGKYHGFHQIIESDDVIAAFRSQVPLHQYEDMLSWWQQQQLYPDVTWPGQPDYFALTSGTTGNKPKRIPVTDSFIDSMRTVASSVARSLPNFDLPAEVFESHILMLSSSANLKKHKNGHLEGEISGININNFPDWYDLFYAPGYEIAKIDDWDKRLQKIVEHAHRWNIGAIAGIPSWVLVMLRAIIKKYDLKYIQDIWPNFQVYASGGVAYSTYRNEFNKLSNRELTIIDTYLASEGFFAHTARPNTMSMKLALAHGYFYEFIPFDERGVDKQGILKPDPVVQTIADIDTGQEYVLVVSTPAGAWRYIIGDTIKFTSLDPHEIVITGRTKFFLNIAGSQLSEEKMDDAVQLLSKEIGTPINEYMVTALKNDNDEYLHQWILVCDHIPDNEQVAEKLDHLLKQSNKNYNVARNKTLTGVKVKGISKDTYNNYLEKEKKKGGQAKIPKVMTPEEMKDLLSMTN